MFRSLNQQYYRGARACVLVCDLTKADSLSNLENWVKGFLETTNCSDDILSQPPIFMLLANKLDLEGDIVIGEKELKDWFWK